MDGLEQLLTKLHREGLIQFKAGPIQSEAVISDIALYYIVQLVYTNAETFADKFDLLYAHILIHPENGEPLSPQEVCLFLLDCACGFASLSEYTSNIVKAEVLRDYEGWMVANLAGNAA